MILSYFHNLSGLRSPYIHDTEATIITSLVSNRLAVAECLNLSISSLIDASFSIYVSVEAT
jgi:hypothetical protein